ncbi:1907_t:CDS:2, partial [Funneliformis caledonium]
RGEVVMVNLNATGNEQHIKLIRYASDDNDIPILYWPGVILETRKVPITDNISDDTTSINSDDYNVVYKAYYKIHLLELSDIVQVDRKSLLPWLVCRVEIPEGFNKNEELEPNVKTYVRAIDRVNKISHTYTPVCSYKHKEAKDSSEKLRLQKYNAILLGTEMIYRNDYIRLTPVDVNEKYNNGQKVPEYLLISNIYQHSTKGIQFTGAGLLRGMLYKGHSKKRTLSDYEWITVNEPGSEYTIDLQDIAGRFYVLFPNLMEKIDWTSPKKLDE